MLLTIERILYNIFDMPRYKRMPCVFLFAGILAALLFFFIVGGILIWMTSLEYILAGALGCGIGTGLVNMLMVEFYESRKL